MFVTPQDLGLEPATMPLWWYLALIVVMGELFACYCRSFNRRRY
jgi:hypothetical protein